MRSTSHSTSTTGVVTVADIEEVERILDEVLLRFGDVDDAARAILPSKRIIRATCPDLALVRFARWEAGTLALLDDPPSGRADIRISVHSDDLVSLNDGGMTFNQAYLSGRVRIDASMSDLLRLRAAL